MSIADVCLLDFDAEMENARRYFAIIPEDKADWKPSELRALLAAAGDEFLMKEWAFTRSDAVLAAGPRAAMYRTMFLHHFIHHRAQLGVNLRILNVPIPGIYGPSADEAQPPAMR